jgi:hypothetical protein
MVRKKHSAEQIAAILRHVEVELAHHKSTGQTWITEQTYYRWQKRIRRADVFLVVEDVTLRQRALWSSVPKQVFISKTWCN